VTRCDGFFCYNNFRSLGENKHSFFVNFVTPMFFISRSPVFDQALLSRWLDDLDLSHKFHLDAFCLVERYCFVAKFSLVNSLLFEYHKDYRSVLFWAKLNQSTDDTTTIIERLDGFDSVAAHRRYSDVYFLKGANGKTQ